MFPDLPALLSFYRLHYLDTTPLIRPAPKRVERVVAKYDFDGSVSFKLLIYYPREKNITLRFILLQDADDLPFRKGEILTVISKDEEQWWTAMNSLGQTGSIPVPYVQKVVVVCFFRPLLLNNNFQIANYFVLFFEMQHDGTDGSVGETANRISNSPTSPSAAPQQQDKTKRPANIQVCC
jgi:proto-oncogene C-crk